MRTCTSTAEDRSSALLQPEMLSLFLKAAEERLRTAPHDATALWAKAQKLRELGDHAAAVDAYAAYAEIQPSDPRGPMFSQLMRGDPDGAVSLGGPVPFLRINNFLPPADLANLWEQVAAHCPRLTASRVVSRKESRIDPAYRASKMTEADKDLRAFMLPRVRTAMAAMGLPARFAIPNLADSQIEMQVTSHTDQEFFRLHRDITSAMPNRALTYLCYLTRPTTRYSGGDLLLLDDDASSFTRIVPTGNTLLFFPSDRWHEVTPVSCDADDPLDTRLTINGWFQRG
jgi:Rps23 Pro-64 3,4-dihydroxylase Tpa1-like proline 4-hydroxylase